jgi:hypothetical protein
MIINGNVDLNPMGLSVIKNAILDRQSSVPAFDAAEAGRVIYNTSTGKYHYNNGTNWQILATASEMNSVGAELDAVESALGSMINATTGAFNVAAFSTFNKVIAPTDILNVLAQLDASIQGHDQFSELEDVTFTNLANGQFTKYDAAARSGQGDWVNHTLVLTDVTDVTATYTEVNQLKDSTVTTADLVKLHGVTATDAELNYLHNADLTAADLQKLADLTATATEINQLYTSTVLTADLNKLHDVTVTAAELNYTSGLTSNIQSQLDGLQAEDLDVTWFGNQTPIALDSETLTINGEEFTNTGLAQFVVSSGSQVEGERWTLASKASARSALGLGDAALLDETNFINATAIGSSNVATDISWNNYKLTSLAPGAVGTDAVNLNQLQAAVAGLSWKQSVLAATTANIDLATGGELTLDGIALLAGDRVLVKNQTSATDNGIYIVSTGAWTRATDFDAITDSISSAAVFVEDGASQADTGWTVTSNVTVLDNEGAEPIIWTQFNGAAGITAGIALTKSGNTLDLNVGAGIFVDGADAINLDVYSANSSALILTDDGATRSDPLSPAAKLHLLLDTATSGQLEQGANGLKVTANAITKLELHANVAGAGLTGAAGAALAVVSAIGTAATGGDLSSATDWDGVAQITVTEDAVGVTLGSTSTTAAPGNHTHKAAVITFDVGTTNLPATVQDAIVAIDTSLDDVAADLSNVKTATGVDATTGEFIAHTASTTSIAAFKSATSMFAVDEALAAEIDTVKTNITNRITKSYYKYTWDTAAKTTHTVTHSTGQQFCNVTVIDITDPLGESFNSVVIPQSIKFDTADQLTVTFNVPVKCVIVVMGVEALA